MTPVAKQQFTCMLCGKPFEDDILEGVDRLAGQDSDFRIHNDEIQPLPYMIHTCPHCGCTGYRHDRALTPEQKHRVQECLAVIAQKKQPCDFSYAQKYEVLAQLLLAIDMPLQEIADAFLKASWSANDVNEQEQSRRLKEYALKYFIKAIENEEVPAVELPVVTYLIGELNRRLGYFDTALEWFATVKTADSQLALLCDQQAAMARANDPGNAQISPPN